MNRPKFLLYPLGLLVLSAGMALAGTTTLTTYYPSPMGYYNQLYAQNVGIGTTVPSSAALTVMNGNVGIGLTNPGAPLVIKAPEPIGLGQFTLIDAANPSTSPAVGVAISGYGNDIVNGTLTGRVWSIGTGGGADPSLVINEQLNAGIIFRTNNQTERMRINATGNVGIGATVPNALLHVKGSGYAAIELQRGVDSNGSDVFLTGSAGTDGWFLSQRPASSRFGIVENTTGFPERVTVLPGGNVGIGMTNPVAPLEVSGNIISSSGYVQALNGPTWADLGFSGYGLYTNGLAYVLTSQPSNWAGIFNNSGGPYGLFSNNNQGYYAELALGSDGLQTNGFVGVVGYSGNSGYPSGVFGGIHTFDGYAEGAWYTGIDGSLATKVDRDGNIWASGTITANSDGRLKQNIKPLTGTLSKLDQLRGVSFEWNHLSTSMGRREGEKAIGMIAQELQKVYPELVVASKNGHQVYLSIDYGKFTAVLLQAIKEQQKEIKDQQKEIEELEKKLGGRK